MYNIYATLLDSFQYMLTGKFDTTEQDIIDQLNRVEIPKTEAMLKGTAFHSLTEGLAEVLTPKDGYYEFEFWKFPVGPVETISEARKGGLHEAFVETYLDTPRGEIRLYGIADTLLRGDILDVKCTGRYQAPRYNRSWQMKTYLKITGSKMIKFLITDYDFVYGEEYTWQQSWDNELMDHIVRVIDFIEARADLITHKKVYHDPRQ